MIRGSGFLLLALVGARSARADTFSPAYPYAVTSARGGYVFKMIPSSDESARYTETPSGTGTAYAVKSDGQLAELWQTSGWYSHKVFLGTDGHTLVRMGPWNLGKGPAPDHLAVAFYRDGKLLKSYSTAELIEDRSQIVASSSHYEWLAGIGSFAPGVRNDESGLSLNESDHTFSLTTIDDRRYEFDTNTGNIKQVKRNVRVRSSWASPEDLERVIVALAVADFPMRSGERETLGLPGKMDLILMEDDGNSFSSFYAVTDPHDPNGYYAVREKVIQPTPRRTSLPDEIAGMDLVYQSASGTVFIVEPDRFPPAELQRMKADRKARKQTPKEFSEEYFKTRGANAAPTLRLR